MILTKANALMAVFSAIDEVNVTLPDEKKLTRAPDAIIFGPEGIADSVTLVNLVMAVENQLYDLLGTEILLASENAMSRRKSPYRCADALADYAVEIATGASAQ